MFLNLPKEIQLTGPVGEGKRSQVYRVRYRDRDAVLKLYRQKFVDKYRSRYGVCIAEFEYERNLDFYENEDLKKYTVEPLAVLPAQGTRPPAFVQAYAPGRPLLDMIAELGFLPKETYEAGLDLVRQARRAGIHDLDINDGNVNVQLTPEGWMPVVYDFNIMPQYLFPTNPLIALSFKLKLKDRSYRDLRSVQGWRMRGMQAERAR